MSIIYDALKKVERSDSLQEKGEAVNPEKIPKAKIKIYLIYGAVACSGLLIGNIVFGFFTREKKITQPASPTAPAVSQPLPPALIPEKPAELKPPANQPQSGLILNGVFFSGNDGYALINNQIVKEGDVIKGAQVKRITLGEVELESAGAIIVLTTNK